MQETAPARDYAACPTNDTQKLIRLPDGGYVLPGKHVEDCACRCASCSEFRDLWAAAEAAGEVE